MKNITLIAAVGKNRELGKDNGLIWSIPEDLKYFRDNTMGKYIVMGMNTFNSLPKLLPGRNHVVLTHRDIELDSSVVVFHVLDDLLQYIETLNEEVMVIGGAMIYSQLIEYASKMILTEIDDSKDADTYFPEFSLDDWDKDNISNYEYNGLEYSRVVYTRRKVK